MTMLNETADEFDAMEMTDDQKRIYNKFTGIFGKKVLDMQLKIEGDPNANTTPSK